MPHTDFTAELKKRTEHINSVLDSFLPEEEGKQATILRACNYSVRDGGKRIRPILMQSAYILCMKEDNSGASFEELITGSSYDKRLIDPFLCAIEMIHSASLVHDDLPCMDNDRLRRGKPSTWAKFGEDMGVLAGDGLMILAFETAGRALYDEGISREKLLSIVKAIKILSEKTGVYGMIGGQTADVELTGRRPDFESLDFIYRLKTSALLEASFMIGAVLAGAPDETVRKLETAAGRLGLAFQIKDDILDETSTEAELGKPVHSDERNEKFTYVSLCGLEKAKNEVESLTQEAKELISEAGSYPFLMELCAFLVNRRS